MKDKAFGAGSDSAEDSLVDALMDDAVADKKQKSKAIPVYTARTPDRPCGWIGSADGFSYAVWAGLRPMTELEAVKMRRGPRDPEPPESPAADGDEMKVGSTPSGRQRRRLIGA